MSITVIHLLTGSSCIPSFNYSFKYDWHAKFGRELAKRVKEYYVECWMPSTDIKKVIMIRDRSLDNLIYKAFPSHFLPGSRFKYLPFNIGNAGFELSVSLLSSLNSLIKHKKKVILHMHGDRYSLAYLILTLFSHYSIPILMQHHGSGFEKLIITYIDRLLFRRIDHFFVLTDEKRQYLIDKVHLCPDKISIQTMGVDFDFFRPIDKIIARKKLGLPLGKKIILTVNRFERTYGLDIILRVTKELKKIYNDIELVIVGGQSKNSLYRVLYPLARSITRYVISFVPPDKLVLYYNAADVFVRYLRECLRTGFSIAGVEALACGTPIVDNAVLKRIPEHERQKVGELPKNVNDLKHCILRVLEMKNKYKNCREIARKYFSWDVIIKKAMNVYKKVIEQYYY